MECCSIKLEDDPIYWKGLYEEATFRASQLEAWIEQDISKDKYKIQELEKQLYNSQVQNDLYAHILNS